MTRWSPGGAAPRGMKDLAPRVMGVGCWGEREAERRTASGLGQKPRANSQRPIAKSQRPIANSPHTRKRRQPLAQPSAPRPVAPFGLWRTNPPGPGDRVTAPIARPPFRSCSRQRCMNRRRRLGLTTLLPPVRPHSLPALPPREAGLGIRRSAVASESDICLGFRIAPVAFPLSRAPVLQYVHSTPLCRDVNRVARAIPQVAQNCP